MAVGALYRAVKKGRNRKIAVLADDVFQAVGLEKAEILVKQFLNMIEWPSVRYEKIVVAASSEEVARRRVGRHSWADMFIMWNMSREGFRQLYDLLPHAPKRRVRYIGRDTTPYGRDNNHPQEALRRSR